MEGIKQKMLAIKNERDEAVELVESLEEQLKSAESRVDQVRWHASSSHFLAGILQWCRLSLAWQADTEVASAKRKMQMLEVELDRAESRVQKHTSDLKAAEARVEEFEGWVNQSFEKQWHFSFNSYSLKYFYSNSSLPSHFSKVKRSEAMADDDSGKVLCLFDHCLSMSSAEIFS